MGPTRSAVSLPNPLQILRSQLKRTLGRFERMPPSPCKKRANFRSRGQKNLWSLLRSQTNSTQARRSMRGPRQKPPRTLQPSRSETTKHTTRLLLAVKLLFSPRFLLKAKLQLSKQLPTRSRISNLRLPPSLSFRKQPHLQPCQKLLKLHPLQ